MIVVLSCSVDTAISVKKQRVSGSLLTTASLLVDDGGGGGGGRSRSRRRSGGGEECGGLVTAHLDSDGFGSHRGGCCHRQQPVGHVGAERGAVHTIRH